MLLELASGLLIGLITGITPGIHVNTAVAILLLAGGSLFSPDSLSILVVAAAIAHTFVDIIPAIFVGIPDEDTAIAILPSHEMVLDGRGVEAAAISAFSSLFALLICLPIFFLLLLCFPGWIAEITPYALLLTSAIMILLERGEVFEGSLSAWRKRFYALFVFTSAGFLGWVALEHSKLAELTPASSVLFPLLTGLFATPTLIWSATSSPKIPEQRVSASLPELKAVASGVLSGMFVSLFPGISSGVATAMAASWAKRTETYISALSSANTANALLCFAVFFAAGKTRSGAAEAISKLGLEFKPEIIGVFIVAGLAACLITLAASIVAANFISSINFGAFSKAVLIFLVVLVYALTGGFGMIVFSIATCIGLAVVMLRVRRVNCMGCLIIPVLLRYF